MSGNKFFSRVASLPGNHFDIEPSDTDLLPYNGVMIYVQGNVAVPVTITVLDTRGRSLIYTISEPNYVLPVLVSKVMATGTTATVIYGLY